jgi:hypothetical protein
MPEDNPAEVENQGKYSWEMKKSPSLLLPPGDSDRAHGEIEYQHCYS